MSAVFSHAIRFEIADKNPITPVRQSAKRSGAPVILDAAELRRLFNELGTREKAMIMIEALTGIRRSQLMGLKWKDVDFIGGRIEITRSVVDQAIGKCKTEATGGFQATRNTRRRFVCGRGARRSWRGTVLVGVAQSRDVERPCRGLGRSRLKLIATAPTLMGRSSPQRTKRPAATGMATRL